MSIITVAKTSDEEAFVDTGPDYEFGSYVYNETLIQGDRKGRLFYSHQSNPMVNLIAEATAPQFVGNHRDLFDFLRDSYPLPGGKCLLFDYLYTKCLHTCKT